MSMDSSGPAATELVRQLERLGVGELRVARVDVGVHRGQLLRVGAVDVERLVLRARLRERVRPARLQIDGVGEHERGQPIDAALRQQIADLVARLPGHPLVDRLPRRLRLVGEVEPLDRSAEVLLAERDEPGNELRRLVGPQAVGDGELRRALARTPPSVAGRAPRTAFRRPGSAPTWSTWAICSAVFPRAPARVMASATEMLSGE